MFFIKKKTNKKATGSGLLFYLFMDRVINNLAAYQFSFISYSMLSQLPLALLFYLSQ